MAKFCGKCGAPLDGATGKCPNCDKQVQQANSVPEKKLSKKEVKATKKAQKSVTHKKKSKKAPIIIIAIILALIIAAVAVICALVYSDKIDIPFVNNIFVSMGLKDEDSKIIAPEEDEKDDEDNEEDTTDTEEDVDLSTNYEVPDFDAEKYFKENTTLKSSFDVYSSLTVSSENVAYDNFYERGFADNPITYEYEMDGTYCGEKEIVSYYSAMHPLYQTYYTASNGDVWMIFEINGSFFASPISYNFADENRIPVMISETDTITSYDSTTNKYYVNVPNQSSAVIKTVARIDAETIEKLTSEEIDKL